MSDHLPECDTAHGGVQCICQELRACEQRVRDELPSDGASALWLLLGHRRGLSAARDAVEGLDKYVHGQIDAADALAAIDALRGEAPKPSLPDGYKPTQTVESATFSGGIRLPWGKRGGAA